jgi:hypothetical protein
MRCSAERLIEALVGAEAMAERRHAEKQAEGRRKAYVVTVSRGFGSRGKETAQELARRLGVRCCDRSILETVARRADVDVDLIKALDEHVRRATRNWIKDVFLEAGYGRERYFRQLVRVVLSISEKGGVIVGRGANLILGPTKAFRVRIVGSLEQCARRIAAREEIDLDEARQRVLEVDRERAEYIRRLYDADINDSAAYDISLNSDRFDVRQMVDLIVLGMQEGGYELPR